MAAFRFYNLSRCGPDVQLSNGGRTVSKTADSHSLVLTGPTIHDGSATAIFNLDSAPTGSGNSFGVFFSDTPLDGDVYDEHGRCALGVSSDAGGCARMVTDGVPSEVRPALGWAQGDKVEVGVTFESASVARVTFRFKGAVESSLLEVPPCGLCFGAGVFLNGNAFTLLSAGGPGVEEKEEEPAAPEVGGSEEASGKAGEASPAKSPSQQDERRPLAGPVLKRSKWLRRWNVRQAAAEARGLFGAALAWRGGRCPGEVQLYAGAAKLQGDRLVVRASQRQIHLRAAPGGPSLDEWRQAVDRLGAIENRRQTS